MLETCDNEERQIPDHGRLLWKFERAEKYMRSPRSFKALAFGIALSCCITRLSAQSSTAGVEHTDGLRGTVVNGVTHEPIGRALVFSPDNRFATMTDDRGYFEFSFPRPEGEKTTEFAGTLGFHSLETSLPQPASANRPTMLMARKMGFLSRNNGQEGVQVSTTQQELTISLVPEARIVGHVILPGSDDSEKIQVELYRRQVREGREHWDPAGRATSRSDGEFRFAELSAGSYKLLTHELLDRDPLTFDPRGQLFGYPAVYYPAAQDFATAAVIRLSPGETFQPRVSPAKKEYYPVKLAVQNAPASLQAGIQVWPQGHAGPGYSLGYNSGEELIEGLLPEGTYTVQVTTHGPNAMTGMLNFTVSGAALSGPAVKLLPNSSITVSVKEEFQHTDTLPQGTMTIRPVPENGRRSNYLQVTLVSAEEFGFARAASLRPPTGPEDESLVIENVQPGRYRVHVNTSIGFVSSITSDGTDLQRQPLVVGLGGSTPPIEITVRDDGAQVEGTIEGTSAEVRKVGFNSMGQLLGNVYFVPMADSGGQFREAWVSPDGKFQLQQLPPGAYRVLAFDRQQPDLEYASDEVMGQYDSKTKVIRVVSGQKEHLRLPVITASE
jgi:hypothetical protein